jgi:hypothetical protein
LGNGLPGTDGQRKVAIGPSLHGIINEEMARHLVHGRQGTWVPDITTKQLIVHHTGPSRFKGIDHFFFSCQEKSFAQLRSSASDREKSQEETTPLVKATTTWMNSGAPKVLPTTGVFATCWCFYLDNAKARAPAGPEPDRRVRRER